MEDTTEGVKNSFMLSFVPGGATKRTPRVKESKFMGMLKIAAIKTA